MKDAEAAGIKKRVIHILLVRRELKRPEAVAEYLKKGEEIQVILL